MLNKREQVQVAAKCGATPKIVDLVARSKPVTLASRVLVILGARNAGLEEKLPESAFEGTELVCPKGRATSKAGA